jgi:hypothetical protein
MPLRRCTPGRARVSETPIARLPGVAAREEANTSEAKSLLFCEHASPISLCSHQNDFYEFFMIKIAHTFTPDSWSMEFDT